MDDASLRLQSVPAPFCKHTDGSGNGNVFLPLLYACCGGSSLLQCESSYKNSELITSQDSQKYLFVHAVNSGY